MFVRTSVHSLKHLERFPSRLCVPIGSGKPSPSSTPRKTVILLSDREADVSCGKEATQRPAGTSLLWTRVMYLLALVTVMQEERLCLTRVTEMSIQNDAILCSLLKLYPFLLFLECLLWQERLPCCQSLYLWDLCQAVLLFEMTIVCFPPCISIQNGFPFSGSLQREYRNERFIVLLNH